MQTLVADNQANQKFHIFFGAVIVIGIFLRVFLMDRIPGINGDEPLFPIRAQNLLKGQDIIWKTGSGVFLNPFYFLPLLSLYLVFEPSFFLLRVPPVFYGILTIFLSYFLLRKSLGEKQAKIFTILIALSPQCIAYSRISWDPCMSVLGCILTMHFALLNKKFLTALFFIIAVIIHPTNIFFFPFTVYLLFFKDTKNLLSEFKKRIPLMIGAVAIILILGMIAHFSYQDGILVFIPDFGKNLLRINETPNYLLNCLNIVTGTTPIYYFVGIMPPLLYLSYTFIFCFTILFSLRKPDIIKAALPAIIITIISITIFFVAGSPDGVKPHLDRYALWLMPIAFYTLSIILAKIETSYKAIYILAVIMISFFSYAYFYQSITKGNQSHKTFVSGQVEPKKEAYNFIHKDAADKKIIIFVEDWWLYWPIKYLAFNEPFKITIFLQEWDFRFPKDFTMTQEDYASFLSDYEKAYFVSFTDSDFDKYAKNFSKSKLEKSIYGYNKEAIINIYSTPGKSLIKKNKD